MASPEHCTLTARLRRFSSCDGQHPACTEYDCDSIRFLGLFEISFYANGSCPEDEGHVSIIFERMYPIYRKYNIPESFSCTASVIDASGSEMFSQSIAFHHDFSGNLSFIKEFGFHRFVKRSTLLNDPSELLPDDCLTLRLEIDYQITGLSTFNTRGFHLENDRCCLRTNSDFVRDLCKMSAVFQSMLESPMAEKVTGSASIPPEEYESLILIFKVLSDYDLYATLHDLYDLYVFADKYDMQEIVHLSHQLLITMMRAAMNCQEILDYVAKDMHMIPELAERFQDQKLREILNIYSDMKNKILERANPLEVPSAINLETGWNYELLRERYSDPLLFKNKRSENIPMDSYK